MSLPFILPSANIRPLPKTIIVIGGGCSGLAMAEALHQRDPMSKITIVDMHFEIHTSNSTKPNYSETEISASRDRGRIIRDDYIHPIYRTIAREAMAHWKHANPWCQFYHESGLALVGSGDEESPLKRTFNITLEHHQSKDKRTDLKILGSEAQIEEVCHIKALEGSWGYLNPHAGWVNAGHVTKALLDKLATLDNLSMKHGKAVSLVKDTSGKTVLGVMLESEGPLFAELVVLATGPWTSTLVDTTGISIASGQPVTLVRVRAEDEMRFANMPAVVDFEQKICMTPLAGGQLRIALHRQDLLNPSSFEHPETGHSEISIPVLSADDTDFDTRCTHLALVGRALKRISPPLEDGTIVNFRYCWYDDTLTSDFIIGHHPDFKGLFMLHGLGAHGFKFLPVIGRYAVAALLGELTPSVKTLWQWPQKVSEQELADHHGQGGWR